VTAPARRRAWTPEADAETATVLRLLAKHPWLVAGRHDDAIAAVRRNEAAVRAALARLGWVLVVERDLVRLRKTAPVRRDAWAAAGPAPRTCSWFFLLVAAAESMAARTGLSNLVVAARAAAAEAGLPGTGDIGERRAIVAALKELDHRGIIEQLEGEVDEYVRDAGAEVLLAVHHTRLAHVIANVGPAEPDRDAAGWLAAVEREPDPARRMRRRLVDDTLVHTDDLDEAEADWLSRRVRGDDGAPLAAAFGLHLERRAEGAAFVVPDDAYRYPNELGPLPFPAQGTVPHAALLLCEQAGIDGQSAGAPGAGWRGFPEPDVLRRLAELAARFRPGRGGWSQEYTSDPDALARQVETLLTGIGLLRVHVVEEGDGGAFWWFSPASGRWPPSTIGLRTRRAAPAASGLDPDFGPAGDLDGR
jgi:uncharacterized protein (TIGR02678 family)